MASLQGQVVCRIGDCAHLDTYAGICCTCGSDVIAQAGRKKDGEEREGGEGTHYGMFGSVSHPAFRRSAQSALNEEVRSVSCTHACHVLDPHTNNTHSHKHTNTRMHTCACFVIHERRWPDQHTGREKRLYSICGILNLPTPNPTDGAAS